MSDTLDRLAAALEETAGAHHRAFAATDGADPEWPLWYAEHLLEEVRSLLGHPQLTKSRLTAALVEAEEAHTAAGGEAPWPRFYAEWLLGRLSPPPSSPT